jgi:tetratricopeptide (TPR) repeat protein
MTLQLGTLCALNIFSDATSSRVSSILIQLRHEVVVIKVQDELKIWLLISTMFISLMPIKLKASPIEGSLQRIADATHLEFKGRSEWKYNLNKINEKTIQLHIPAFDDKTLADLQTWTDPLIENIKVQKDGPNGQYTVTFTFKDANIESFDYLTDDPSRLIIDIYKKEEPSNESKKEIATQLPPKFDTDKTAVSKVDGYKKINSSNKSNASSSNEYKKRNENRMPSSEYLIVENSNPPIESKVSSGVYDSGDPKYNRFRIRDYEIKEEAIISSRENIYIRFPRVRIKTSQLDKIRELKPEYVINENSSEENKEARFLQTLYNNKRDAAYIKSFNYFEKKYSDSNYLEILRNMLADLYFERWKKTSDVLDKEKLVSTLTYLIEKYPDSVLTERSELTLAYMHLENKSGVETIQHFLKFLNKRPDSKHFDQARKSLYEGYLILNKFEDATQILEELIKNPKDKTSAIEAKYRLGDVYFQSENFKKAIESYNQALTDYPAFESEYENLNYNLAEAYFWTGQFKKSLEHYVRFIELFPTHTQGGYTLTRIGEVLEILGADTSKSMGAYLESTYRFKKSDASDIARVRMLSQKMKNMKEKEMSQALEEMNEIAKSSKLPRMEEFVSLMVADGLHRRGEYSQALDYLIKYYQKNPTTADLIFFKGRILKNITDQIKLQIEQGSFLTALSINDQYSTTWLNNLERIDIPYFIGKAYEMAGAFKESEMIYNQTLKKLKKIENTREEKERRVTEYLPYLEQVQLRLAQVAFQRKDLESSESLLKQIKSIKTLKSPEQIERVELLAKVSEQRGQLKEAKDFLKELIKVWEGSPELIASSFLQLAKLQHETGELNEAELNINEVENLVKTTPNLPEDIVYEWMELKSKNLESSGRVVAAIESYTEFLDKFESKKPMDATRFHLGKLLFSHGNVKGAEKVWNSLSSERSPMYVKLAQEKLNNAKWVDEYKKYIQRIPAAENLDRSLE